MSILQPDYSHPDKLLAAKEFNFIDLNINLKNFVVTFFAIFQVYISREHPPKLRLWVEVAGRTKQLFQYSPLQPNLGTKEFIFGKSPFKFLFYNVDPGVVRGFHSEVVIVVDVPLPSTM